VPFAIKINAVGILDVFLLDFSSLLVKKYGRSGDEVVDLKQEVIALPLRQYISQKGRSSCDYSWHELGAHVLLVVYIFSVACRR